MPVAKKKHIIGIDTGSTSSSVVVIDESGMILQSSYLFHRGQIADTLRNQLSEIDVSKIHAVAYTSSCPDIFKTGVKNDIRVSYITAAKYFNPDPEALLIIGGEKFGLVHFNKEGEYQKYRANSSCAAGTGSFLDQQLSRLNLKSISLLSELAYNFSGDSPKIASRCSVFAKTDLIHAQQEGYSLAAICNGLCYGLAKNVVDAVFDEGDLEEIIVAGGVSLNAGVLRHIHEITGARLLTGDYSHLYGAIGTALMQSEGLRQQNLLKLEVPDDIISPPVKKKQYYNPALELRLSEYPDFSGLDEYRFLPGRHPELSPVEVSVYEPLQAGGNIPVYLGIDIGSTSTKAVLLDMDKNVIAGLYTRTSGQPLFAVQNLFEAVIDLQERKRFSFDVKGAGTTGSGRKLIGEIILADVVPDEITAHARAAVELDPETDTIIEIGGQDSKFTLMRDGIVILSIMNNVCAAGTGSFIEEQAQKLDCPLSEYAERASRTSSPMTSDRCTVFMERDLNHYLNEGYEKDELLASVLHSIRDNYLSKVTGKARIGNRIFFQGATAKNKALVAAFEQKLHKPIRVSRFCHLTGALGVTLELHDKNIRESTFRGLDLWKMDIPVHSEVCDLCTNNCKLRVAEINGENAAYGFLCGRDYNTKSYVKTGGDSFDLLKEYSRLFRFRPLTRESEITVGIPPVLHLAEEKLLWQKFFDLLGIKTITSEGYRNSVREGKKHSDAEFCSPMSAAYGHVYHLQEKADYIFLPVYLENGKSISSSKKYCYYTQHLSAVIASTREFRDSDRILKPLVRSLRSESHAINELHSMLHKLGLKQLQQKQVKEAYDEALEFFGKKQKEWKNIYLEKVREDELNIVLLGRPYAVLDSSMNSHIPEIIRKKGYPAFYMDMLPEKINGNKGDSPLLKVMTWKYASEIIRVTGQLTASENLYPILVTSFKCTPDSFVIEYFRDILEASGKPYLILQLDEHDSSVGYETRIEAAIRSFRNHYNNRQDHIREIDKEDTGARPESHEPVKGFLYEIEQILGDHSIDRKIFHRKHPDVARDYNLSSLPHGKTSSFNGKTILLPGWDLYAGKLVVGVLEGDGKKAALLPDTEGSIQRSLNTNTGQCLPLNVVTQNAYEYIRENRLHPSETVIWVPNGYLACNLTMFPHYIRKLMKRFGGKMGEVNVYPGNLGFYDFSVKLGVNAYLAYFFAGSIRKIACKIRPYEKIKGSTNSVYNHSLELLYEAFRDQSPKEPVLNQIMKLFDQLEFEPGSRPRVAIFGDLYARDNDIFNQDLIRVIEENGGEAITTSYSEYIRIILKQMEKRLFLEGRYLEHYNLRVLKYLIPLLENRYSKYFEKYITNINPLNDMLYEILEKHNLDLMHRGETVDNVLKIETLLNHYDDISLFVQTNPAYCCPSLVTQAMSGHLEKLTGIPVVSIEYDGTHGAKNEEIIPYLKLGKSVSMKVKSTEETEGLTD